jgi:hypothetical protein
MLFGGLTFACSWLNNRNFGPVESMSAEYKAAEAKNINVSSCCFLLFAAVVEAASEGLLAAVDNGGSSSSDLPLHKAISPR